MFLTIQELFNKSVAGLAKQGFRQAMADTGYGPTCTYRRIAADGSEVGCAIGVLVPPNKRIPPGCNGISICGLPPKFVAAIGIDCDNRDLIEFLMELQSAHDLGSGPERMKVLLTALGNKYELPIPRSLKRSRSKP